MDLILPVPSELSRERDEVIHFANHGGEIPKGLDKIKQWFAEDEDVWANLHSESAAMNFHPAISTKYGLLYRACDSELRDHIGLSDHEEITDIMRTSFVRDLLSENWDSDNPLIVGIAHRWLENSDGQRCLIGFTEELEGQGGVVCYWQGVFVDEEGWYDHLKKEGYIRANSPEDLSDKELLSLYINLD